MEKQNVPGSPSVINQKGDYLVLLNSKCVGEEGLSTFVFASDLSLEAAVFMSLNLYKTVPQSVVYVVHRETRDLFESFYTLRLVSDEK